MKVLVEEFVIKNRDVMRNIVNAVENVPLDGLSYEVLCKEIVSDPISKHGMPEVAYAIKIFRHECVV